MLRSKDDSSPKPARQDRFAVHVLARIYEALEKKKHDRENHAWIPGVRIPARRPEVVRSILSRTSDLTDGGGKHSRCIWVLAQAMYTYYSEWILKYRKWKTRVANPVEKPCAQGS
jgi:hypothetical protein